MSVARTANLDPQPEESAPLSFEGTSARLVLSDGTEFPGYAFGSLESRIGEVVFTTGMVGYPESLTDPSYRGQLLAMTYPLVGNYGVRPRLEDEHGLFGGFEADRIHARGLIVSTLSHDFSHWQSARSLDEWLREEGVVGIQGVDTRALTRRLRTKGSTPAKIIVDGSDSDVDDASPFVDVNQANLVAEVSCSEPITYAATTPEKARCRIAVVDCGAKANIIRSLASRGAEVIRVPWNHDLASVDCDGFLVSNGPGDPAMVKETVANLKTLLEGTRPVFGICLGNQLVGRAAGGRTYKLDFGHRSQNQPCVEVGTKRCLITSQNHGYALDTTSLPEDWEPWFVNANDGTNEGIRSKSKPHRTVQFHPEATPGPTDAAYLFDEFLEELS